MRPAWMEFARCTDTDPDLWFPDDGQNPKWAKAICRTCFVCADCLEYALANPGDTEFGVWGALSVHERERLRRARRAA